MGGTTVFDYEFDWQILVDHDLLVLEQLEEAIERNLFDVRVSAAAKEDGEADQGKGDRDEDNAAPIEIGLVPAWFVLFLRIAVWLRHKVTRDFTRERRLT